MSETEDRERAWQEWLGRYNGERWTRLEVLDHRRTFMAGWEAAMLRALEVTTEGARDAGAEEAEDAEDAAPAGGAMRVSQDDVRNAIESFFRETPDAAPTVKTLEIALRFTESQIRAALADMRGLGLLKRRRTRGPIIGSDRWEYEYSMATPEAP